ncbi:MAG: DUF58 domain-containing protein [Pirellula sp.]
MADASTSNRTNKSQPRRFRRGQLTGFGFDYVIRSLRMLRSAKKAATPVSTRLTREGVQVSFMAAFVLLGAVIRNVNLLIVLAGALLGLLLIQWRVCAKTLYGLTTVRRLPRVISARRAFDIELSILNPKSWLGSWLVLAHDRIASVSDSEAGRNVSQGIRLLFGSIPPTCTRIQKYRCVIQRRGKYEFLGTELTTRFPMGLMRGILPSKSGFESFVVQPSLGRLLPNWGDLFDIRRANARLKRTKSLSDEGEFFGLRSYRPGDSPRWIHWRSSARRDELVVKQFQNENSRELVVLLDLFRPGNLSQTNSDKWTQQEDLAVEFVGTLVHHIATSNFGLITVGIADSSPAIAARVQSRSQGNGVLDRLAVAKGCEGDEFFQALRMIEVEHRRAEHLLVVSTRPRIDMTQHRDDSDPVVFWRTLNWLDVNSSDLKKYFAPGETFE